MVSLQTVNKAIGRTLPTISYTITPHKVALYALGIGAPADPLDKDDLKFVYELHPDFCALPTMPVVYSGEMIHAIVEGNIAGIEFNPMMLVHGEESLVLHRPLPTEGIVHCTPTVKHIYDKGSGMVVVIEVICIDDDNDPISTNTSQMFIRGLGDFGGERGSSEKVIIPEREPDAVYEDTTLPTQALIYRLSGDINPLHADPDMAAQGNFDKPILHGLATFGFAGRAVLAQFADNDPARIGAISARFSREVYPGDTLVTEMWQEANDIIFQMKTRERDTVVLSNARATLLT